MTANDLIGLHSDILELTYKMKTAEIEVTSYSESARNAFRNGVDIPSLDKNLETAEQKFELYVNEYNSVIQTLRSYTI